MKDWNRRDWMKTAALGAVGAGALGGAVTGLRADTHGKNFAEDFTPDWELKMANAVEMAEAMPADKWTFKPTEEMRSFGELMVHIAESNYFFAAQAAGTEVPEDAKYKGEKTKEAVVAYMKKSFESAAKSVAMVEDARAEEVVDLFGGIRTSRKKICEFMRDHVTHHLGYSVPYLRLSGITEIPAYRFTGGDQSPR